MDKTKQKITDMVSDMNFERKKPVSKQTKQELAALQISLEQTLAKLNKLHLALWHAQEKSDYHSTSVEEIKQELRQIRDELDRIC